MAKVRTPNQKSKYKELNKRLAKYVLLVEQIYDELNLEAAQIALTAGYDGSKPFRFKDYPKTKDRVNKLKKKFVDELGAVIYRGTSDEWKQSNLVQDLLADKVLKTYGIKHKGKKEKVYYQVNSDALKSFQERKDNGMSLSAKLWNQAANYRQEMEYAISSAVQKGTSAVTLSKRLSKYLQDFPKLQKDYKEKFGKAVDCHDCEYRSIRLARSEINMAYRTAEQTRWQQMDFVVGYEIKTSHMHKVKDICDELAGRYPKDFQWTGWHPNCYSDDSSVLTNNGWKLFKDVEDGDLILSLNPETKTLEYVSFVARQVYDFSGKMMHFSNKSLDCLVTEDHKMVYLNKHDSKVKTCIARDYTKGKGAFYRGCEYDANDIDSIEIGGEIYSFDDYCELMGYYLADGSLRHNSGVVLSQKEGEPARNGMLDLVKRLGVTPYEKEYTIEFYKTSLNRYLKRFGKSYQKFIPEEILNASRRQIGIFLNAFILCDGYKRPCKTFVGNRCNVFASSNEERMYFTTSKRMAGGLCELLLKIGKRPSLRENKLAEHKCKGKTIKSNYPCIIISECSSLTASVFNKEEVDYNGKVYDLTLEKNHIMYISRNGKCFWGSNCMDYVVPILNTEEEFWSDSTTSVNEVKDVPEGFKKWVDKNIYRIEKAEARRTLPYFVKDNKAYVDNIRKDVVVKILKSNTNSLPKETLREIGELEKRGVSYPVVANAAAIIAKEQYNTFTMFEKFVYGQSKIVDGLIDELKELNKTDGLSASKIKLINEIKGKSAILTRWNLRKADAVSGLSFKGLEKNTTFADKEDRIVSKTGELVKVKPLRRDALCYEDKLGVKYYYPLGAKAENIVAKAGDAAKYIEELPPKLRGTFKGVLFDLWRHPLDEYYLKEYDSFTYGAMYSNAVISVHHKYPTIFDFGRDFIHEIGHRTDFGVSNSARWAKAVKDDGYYCSRYAMKSLREDYAESFAMAYLSNVVRRQIPHRWMILKQIFSDYGII